MQQGATPQEVADALARVYAREEFSERGVPALLQLIRDVRASVTSWIRGLLSDLLPESWPAFVSWLLLALLVIAAALALFHLVRAVAGPRHRVAVPEPLRLVEDGVRDVAWWEAAARAAAAQGRFRDAAQALYRAVLHRLDEADALRYQADKTPGEYRREVHAHPARSSFDRFVRQFLPVAFGARAPDSAAFEALRASAAQLNVHA